MLKRKEKPLNTAERGDDHLSLERLIFFSDAVFAIAITLLALEIRLPYTDATLTNNELAKSLLEIWPKYLGYGISFLVIGSFWVGHHRKFRHIKRYDGNLLLINLIFLMVIAFIPFPASVISEFGNRTATIFYASVMVLASLLSAALWAYTSNHNRLTDPMMDSQNRLIESKRTLAVSMIFLLSIGIAFINDDLAKVFWLLILVTTLIFR
jgi:uncharacterized membrane protein